MQSKYKLPEWASEGPEDLEYRTYKMMSHVKSLKNDLLDQKLLPVLFEVDSTLDYLYRYDALKMTEEDTKVDYLEVDDPIPGQAFVCLSFVSPESMIQAKEGFKVAKFLQSYAHILLIALKCHQLHHHKISSRFFLFLLNSRFHLFLL